MSEVIASTYVSTFSSLAFQDQDVGRVTNLFPGTGQLGGLLRSGFDKLGGTVERRACEFSPVSDVGLKDGCDEFNEFNGMGAPPHSPRLAGSLPEQAIPEHSRLPSSRNPASWEGERMSGDSTDDAIQTDGSRHAEDDRLVARAQKGDATAFDLLVGRHTSRLYGLVYHMTGNHEDTNDLLQDVWTKVFRSLAGFRGASRFTTWIHSIAVNMSINFLKRRNRRQTVSLDAGAEEGGVVEVMENMLVSPHTPRTEAGISELQSRLSDALGRLSPEHRAVVTMFDIQGMAHAEIGRILGVSEGTVRSRLFYAHRQLQAFLSDLHMEGAVV
jgi:RNA polymerase sigma factor (sigma-70 family)